MQTNGYFISPSYGVCDLPKLRKLILKFIADRPDSKYRLVIGSDSQPKNSYGTDFVTAIVVHRIGCGGIYFWKQQTNGQRLMLRQRMYQEASFSLSTAYEVVELFAKDGLNKFDVEIHVDVGQKGETREMIAEIVGMIRGSGFAVKTKPDAFGASKVADRHT